MAREQLDLLIEYINLKVRLANTNSPSTTYQLQDKLVDKLRELEESCND